MLLFKWTLSLILPFDQLPKCFLQLHFKHDQSFFPQIMKIILHGLHLTQKACSYCLCKQLIKKYRLFNTQHKFKKKNPHNTILRLWSSIFEFVIFKMWLNQYQRTWMWYLALHVFLFAGFSFFFFFLIIGKIVCKISIVQAGVEMGMLNTHWFIYRI